tara:strand:- start:1651 stop:1863 length:213 start_codon:yes stop_codon:yes gene_type:complete
MIFNFDKKEYDSDKLDDQGKLYLQQIQNLLTKKHNVMIEFNNLEILQKHYSDLLKDKLPKEEKKKQNTGA